jgi:tetratricopeptide (TPR) repeat protein
MLIKWLNFQKKALFFPSLQLLLTAAIINFSVGCSTPVRPAPKLNLSAAEISKQPNSIINSIKKLEKEHERNAVLNLTDIAMTALSQKDKIAPKTLKELVDKSLDLAIDRIEDIYADTPEAKKARSLWHDEATKDFKGEPYERSFVFFLRGLRYYEAGDFDNAIACFKSGIIQDSLSVEGKFNADMANIEWMIGLCHQKLGESEGAKEAFKRAAGIRPDLLAPDKDDNALIIFFVGNGPVKKQTGKYKDILLFELGKSLSKIIMTSYMQLGTNPSYHSLKLFEDVFFQATTRGGRQIDKINKHKSTVKDNTKIIGNLTILLGLIAIGTALIVAASAQGGSPMAAAILGGIGIGLLALGIGAHIAAKLMKTKADIRTFKSIPGKIFIQSGKLIPGSRLIGILTSNLKTQGKLRFKKSFIHPNNNHNVVYVFCP